MDQLSGKSPSRVIELVFLGGPEPELQRILFDHPLFNHPTLLLRGVQAASAVGGSPLPWTSAVKALAILFVRGRQVYAESGKSGKVGEISVGVAGPLGRTLDFALGKRPLWLLDLFGVTDQGASRCGRFFHRTNPEGKRGGEISVLLNQHMLPLDSISIIENGVVLTDAPRLANLAGRLEQSTLVVSEKRPRANGSRKRRGAGAADCAVVVENLPVETKLKEAKRCSACATEFRNFLAPVFKEELSHLLLRTSVFDKNSLVNSVVRLETNSLFTQMAGKKASDIRQLVENSDSSLRMGLPATRPPEAEAPFTLSVSCLTLGALSLFDYLRACRRIEIEINWNFATGIQVARDVISGNQPELCVAAAPSVAEMLAHRKDAPYLPVMMMPVHPHRIVGAQGAERDLAKGNYFFYNEAPSGPSFYYHELERRNFVKANTVALRHCDADELFSPLLTGDTEARTISWFPIYKIAEKELGATLLDTAHGELGDNFIVLMASEELRKNSRRLKWLLSELHHAWLMLREDTAAADAVVDRLLSNPEYVRLVRRSCGMTQLDESRRSLP